MEVNKISSAIEQAGLNPFGVSGTGDNDAMKLAQQNGISVEEAKSILQEAEKRAQENDKMMAQQSAMLDVLNSQDEEELVEFDDADFDNFLNEQSPEQQMQDMMNRFQFSAQDNMGQSNQQNFFSQGNNPFLKMK